MPTADNYRNWETVVAATAVNLARERCDAGGDASCTGLTEARTVRYGIGSDAGETVTDALGGITRYNYDDQRRLTAVSLPERSGNDLTVTYGTDGRVATVARRGVTWTYAYQLTGTTLRTTATAPGKSRVVVADTSIGRPTSDTDGVGRTTSYQYDGQSRVIRVTRPWGDAVGVTYDARGNVTETRHYGRGGGDILVGKAVYPGSCLAPITVKTCNKPISTTDALLRTTTYQYSTEHGGVTVATAPAVGGVAPQTRFTYVRQNAIYRQGSDTPTAAAVGIFVPDAISACARGSACVSGEDEARTVIGHDPATNLLPTTVTRRNGTGTLVATTGFTYDYAGDVRSANGPLAGDADTTMTRRDKLRRVEGVIGPDPAGTNPNVAQRMSYYADGRLNHLDLGTTNGQSNTAWNAFTMREARVTAYDADYRPNKVSHHSNTAQHFSTTHLKHDGFGRLTCRAVRVAEGSFNAGDACVAMGTTFGLDQVEQYGYNAEDELTHVTRGAGSPDSRLEIMGYGANGLETVTDGRGNVTRRRHDAWGRLASIEYPSPGGGGSNPADYEQFTYDNAGNVRSFRRRDTKVIRYEYDELGRMEKAELPDVADVRRYTYDNFGRAVRIVQGADELSMDRAYDTLGRLTTDKTGSSEFTFEYNLAGALIRIGYPDDFSVSYEVDAAGRTTKVRETGVTTGAGVLGTYVYDTLGRPTSLTRGNGVVTTWAWDNGSRLTSLNHDLAGTGQDGGTTFDYSAANQIVRRTVTRPDLWAWRGEPTRDVGYAANGLDQYSYAGLSNPQYSLSGNLVAQAGNGFGYAYDAENKLRIADDATRFFDIRYDPAGRIRALTTDGVRMVHGGAHLMAEYAGSTLIKRHVFGPGLDAPLATYSGSTRAWHLQDERGSVVAQTNASGVATATWGYGPHGEPDERGSPPRFGYAGAVNLPELGLVQMRARTYLPALGRFLQPDPIGQAGGVNIYDYAGGDPVNSVDPWGLEEEETITVTAPRWQPNFLLCPSCTTFFPRQYYDGIPLGGATSTEPSRDAKPEETQPDCNTVLPNGKTVGDIVRGGVEDTITPSSSAGSNTDAAADMQGKMLLYTVPHGPMDFKNKFRGQASPTFLAAAGNFAYGAYVSALAGPNVSTFGAKLYGTVAGWLGLKSETFLAPNGMSKSGAANVPRGNNNAGCPR